MKTMHERIKSLRLKNKLSLSEVSSSLGVSTSTYRDWENGRKIQGEPYMTLAKIFGVSLNYLLSGEEAEQGVDLLLIQAKLEDCLEHIKKSRGFL